MTKADITTTELGRFGENAAVKHLKRKGYRILARNFRAGKNEIDIIASRKNEIIFIEVKARTLTALGDLPYGSPLEAVDTPKQKRTLAAASAYLCKSETEKMPRFDIIEVYLKHRSGFFRTLAVEKICHIEDAFGS
ncbi:MAG: YraN family protein [Clostridia bacterium]|nr:YraN family protein [Clostridia bacterium]